MTEPPAVPEDIITVVDDDGAGGRWVLMVWSDGTAQLGILYPDRTWISVGGRTDRDGVLAEMSARGIPAEAWPAA